MELLAGARRRDQASIVEGFRGLTELVPERTTWERVEGWVGRAADAGERFGIMDLLIAATAAEHEAKIWSLDADFVRIQRLGFVQVYAGP